MICKKDAQKLGDKVSGSEIVIINGKKAIGKYRLKNYPDKPIYAVRAFDRIYYCGNLLQETLRDNKQDAYLDAGVPKFADSGVKWE